MKRIKSLLALFGTIFGLALFSSNALAWSSGGHMLVAAEAFRQLSPELQAQVIEVLKAHPDYQQWVAAYHPNPNMDLATYCFMRCSTWPDEIRRTGNKYDHPDWHFIDYPLRPPNFPFELDERTNDDVLYGVAQCEATLSETNADPELRAADLSYLVHLIGDMHQPLHCESLFTAAYPKGDRGGNDFFVRPAQNGVRLHGIWDGLLGNSVSPLTQWKYAVRLQARFPRSALWDLSAHTTPKEWSLESRQLAIDYGYLRGALKGGQDAASAPPLPANYLRDAKTVAERQGALAGYRLADEITKYLKLDKTVPLLSPNHFTAAQMKMPARIGTAEADKYYDETMVVTGKVVQVSVRSNIAILDFDAPYPDSPLTAVVFDDNFGPFGDLHKYEGHDVEITGTITQYHDKPEIILETPDQIKIK